MTEGKAEKQRVKIVIIGLDNSGKTSILLSLQKHTNLLSYFSLKPTQGLDIVKIEDETKQYSIWELGGQEKYREGYLKNLKKYTMQADQIIFVIDVQDIPRYELALEYLSQVYDHLKDEPIELSIFLHKFDPGLEEIEKFSTEQISKTLISRINSIISPDFNFKIYKTSIYTVFRKILLQ
ncbi:MAG: ADP-ribosylation factor-like protein [Candidatus Helarchaeota archaeon]